MKTQWLVGFTLAIATCAPAALSGPLPASSVSATNNPQAPAQMTPEQIKVEMDRLQAEIDALTASPDAPADWQEMRSLLARLSDSAMAKSKEEEPIRHRMMQLAQSQDVMKWRDRIGPLSLRLEQLRSTQEIRILGDARDLYGARHKELAKWAPAATPKAHALGLDTLSYPRVDGSTSALPLALIMACRILGAEYAWGASYGPDDRRSFVSMTYPPVVYGNMSSLSGSRHDAEYQLAEYAPSARIDLPAQTRLATIINRIILGNASTHDAYINLIEGRSDIGLLARPPSSNELELARTKGAELETAPCALDAFVFLVNDANPLRNLSTARLRDIYSGKITKWQEVGGADEPITAYQREEDSGSQELMRQLVMKELPLTKPDEASAPQLILDEMGGPYVKLTSNPNGLAYSVYYYEQYMAGSPRTRTIAVDGVEPNFETIRSRKYPYTAEVLIVTRKGLDPKSPTARLRDWLLSPEGQSVVRESGYVPISAVEK